MIVFFLNVSFKYTNCSCLTSMHYFICVGGGGGVTERVTVLGFNNTLGVI